MRTDQTLLEQMKISDVNIASRMDLLLLSKEELEILSASQKIIDENIDIIVEEFYEAQLGNEEISLVIGDADTLQRLHNAQRRYVIDLFSGHYDREYVNNRLRIGNIMYCCHATMTDTQTFLHHFNDRGKAICCA